MADAAKSLPGEPVKRIIEMIKKLDPRERKKLLQLLEPELIGDTTETHLASENILAKEWLLPEEDEAWKHL